jgi:hypothetical protein
MKKLLFLCIGALMAVAAFAQEDSPTANWPYLFPEFKEGEIIRTRGKSLKALLNIHLDMSALYYVDEGMIKEANTLGMEALVIGEDVFRNVGGRMMKVMAEAEGGLVVQEAKANFSGIVRNDGAYGSTALNSTTTKTFLYNENAINQYNGYLLTTVYADLLAMKNDAEKLPVNRNLYLVIGLEQIPANKKSVAALDGLDRKAFSAFMKSEKIEWDNPQDLVKVLDYIKANRK